MQCSRAELGNANSRRREIKEVNMQDQVIREASKREGTFIGGGERQISC